MKLPQIKDLFASTERAAVESEERRQKLLAEAQAESDRLAFERDVIDRLERFQNRLTAYRRQLVELREMLDERKTRRDYDAALEQAIACCMAYPQRQPLRLDDVHEAILIHQNAPSLLKCAERFVGKLEVEVETFMAEHREILERHGAAF